MSVVNKKLLVTLILLETLVVGLLTHFLVTTLYDDRLHVYHFSVGQGDGTLIRTPWQQSIVIDGGPGKTILEKLGKTLPLWDRTIDVLILTHTDSDHVSGALEVLATYRVRTVVDNFRPHSSILAREFVDVVEESGIPRIDGDQLSYLSFGDGRLVLEFFENPDPDIDNNNASIMTRLEYADFDALFPGDAESETEEAFLKTPLAQPVDVLQFGHHGSKSSSSARFLETMDPILAIASVGIDNRFGHPAEETLERAAAYDITVLRTDSDGDIHLITDGEYFWIR